MHISWLTHKPQPETTSRLRKHLPFPRLRNYVNTSIPSCFKKKTQNPRVRYTVQGIGSLLRDSWNLVSAYSLACSLPMCAPMLGVILRCGSKCPRTVYSPEKLRNTYHALEMPTILHLIEPLRSLTHLRTLNPNPDS